MAISARKIPALLERILAASAGSHAQHGIAHGFTDQVHAPHDAELRFMPRHWIATLPGASLDVQFAEQRGKLALA
jgi:hypothetical protein